MTSRLLFGLTGPLWMICGVVIGLSRPISDGRYAQGMPLVGWVLVALGAYMIIKAIREPGLVMGRPTLRASPRRDQVKTIALTAIVVALGAWSLWQGVSTGRPSAICTGLVLLSVVPMLLARDG